MVDGTFPEGWRPKASEALPGAKPKGPEEAALAEAAEFVTVAKAQEGEQPETREVAQATRAEAVPQRVEITIPDHPKEALENAQQQWQLLTSRIKSAFGKLGQGITAGKDFAVDLPAKITEIWNRTGDQIADAYKRFDEACGRAEEKATKAAGALDYKVKEFGLSTAARVQDPFIRLRNSLEARPFNREARKAGKIALREMQGIEDTKSKYGPKIEVARAVLEAARANLAGLETEMTEKLIKGGQSLDNAKRGVLINLKSKREALAKQGWARRALEGLKRAA